LKVKSDDILVELKEVHRSLSGVVARTAKKPAGEGDVWSLYARSERLAAVLKIRLGVERPGVFLKIPRSDNPQEFVSLALDSLRDAIAALETARQLDGLESIRTARTYLRAFLADGRRAAMRAKRKSSAASRLSSA